MVDVTVEKAAAEESVEQREAGVGVWSLRDRYVSSEETGELLLLLLEDDTPVPHAVAVVKLENWEKVGGAALEVEEEVKSDGVGLYQDKVLRVKVVVRAFPPWAGRAVNVPP